MLNNKNYINTNQIILYGYLPSRDKWISESILKKSSIIPFIGLKK
jgi:hypothetical protein